MPWSTPQRRAARARAGSSACARRVDDARRELARAASTTTRPSRAPRFATGRSSKRPAAATHRALRVARARRSSIARRRSPARRSAAAPACLNSQARCPVRAFCEYRSTRGALERPRRGRDGEATRHRDASRARRAARERFRGRPSFAALRQRTSVRSSERALARRSFATRAGRCARSSRSRPSGSRPRSALWLELERERAPFRVVARRAARADRTIAGQSSSVRIDRLDRLADGSLAIIDYKTGAKRASQHGLVRGPAARRSSAALRRVRRRSRSARCGRDASSRDEAA